MADEILGQFRHSSANRGRAHPVYASSSSVYGLNTKIPFGEQMLGKKAITNLLPMQPGDVSTTFADTHRLQALVDFAPYTPLAEGIARFVEWYREFVGPQFERKSSHSLFDNSFPSTLPHGCP